jgi:hypothetical protein
MPDFLVNIFYIGTGSHDTVGLVAVDQSECMAKFMNYLFPESVDHEFLISDHAVSFVAKPV